jgi:hypothetical protein
MKSLKLVAATALIAATTAAPAMARSYCDNHRCYHHYYHRGPVGAAADVAGGAVGAAAGLAGAAIGTAGAIATAPFRGPGYRDPYAPGYRDSYAYDYYSPANGFACRPGTWFKGADGRRHPCQ